MLCTREEDVDPVGCAEKATFVLRVAADKGDDDHFGLLALEVVDTCEPHALEKARLGYVLPLPLHSLSGSVSLKCCKLIQIPIIDAHCD